MANEQELNRKLAEWAGFEFVNKDRYMVGVPGAMLHGYWMYPKPKEQMWGYCPNFTQSLDACFKWLVPKLDGIVIRATRYPTIPQHIPDGFHVVASIGALEYGVENKDPALTLCLAIEKLITLTSPHPPE